MTDIYLKRYQSMWKTTCMFW